MTKIVNCYSGKKSSSGKRNCFHLRYFNLGLFVLIAVFGSFYLFNINALTVQGFVLHDLKSQVRTLASEKAEKEEKINAFQSYYSLNSRTQKLNMVAVGNVEYIVATHSSVAKK